MGSTGCRNSQNEGYLLSNGAYRSYIGFQVSQNEGYLSGDLSFGKLRVFLNPKP